MTYLRSDTLPHKRTQPTTTAAIFLHCYLECIFLGSGRFSIWLAWTQVCSIWLAVISVDASASPTMYVCVVGRGCCPPQHLLISSDFKSWLFLAPGLITVPFFPCLPPGQLACGRIRLPGCLEGCGICYCRRFNICQIFNSGLRCGFMDRVILCVLAVQVHKTILQAGPFPFSVKAG